MLRTSYNLAAIKFWPHRLMVRTPPFQGENPGSNPSGAAKIINDPNGSFFILPQVPRRIRQSANGTHGEYADKQLANPQKRICYIRVFAWRLIIVYQGGEWGCQNKMTTIWWSFYFVKHPDENRRFDTIVGKNKRNALRAVRALRVVSATNNPSGAAKIINDPNGSFFILPQVPRRMRQSANGTHGV